MIGLRGACTSDEQAQNSDTGGLVADRLRIDRQRAEVLPNPLREKKHKRKEPDDLGAVLLFVLSHEAARKGRSDEAGRL